MVDSPYYLFNRGSESSTIATGMRRYPLKVSISSESHLYDNYTYGNGNMKLTAHCGTDNPGGWILWKLSDQAISLTSYNTLYVKATVVPYGNGGIARFGLSTNGSITDSNFNSSIDMHTINEGIFTLNVRNLNSAYWLYFWQQNNGTGSRGTTGTDVTISQIYVVS